MLRVNATGCSLLDKLYGHVDFSSPTYQKLISRSAGDGGLVTGGLVFAEALTGFAVSSNIVPAADMRDETGRGGEAYHRILCSLTGDSEPDSANIGGPGIVPLIHASQVKRNPNIRYRFAGVLGRDENGRYFRKLLAKAGFSSRDFSDSYLPTPSSDVLSDPDYNDGRGERTFINMTGAAGSCNPDSLPNFFFDADFLLFGGTALVPPIHDNLENLCRRGQESGAFVMVTTVFDFRNESRFQGKPWPLVKDYTTIDLLTTDKEEAIRISGEHSPTAAMEWFLGQGCRAVVITQGAEDVLLGRAETKDRHQINDSAGSARSAPRFLPLNRRTMPTCRYADKAIAGLKTKKDTTGCGDNFVGGLIDSLAHQMTENRKLNLEDAVISGVVAGSVALTCLGGVYYEQWSGQKFSAMKPYFEAYHRELAGVQANDREG